MKRLVVSTLNISNISQYLKVISLCTRMTLWLGFLKNNNTSKIHNLWIKKYSLWDSLQNNRRRGEVNVDEK